MSRAATGDVRLQLLLHTPPTDPAPVAVVVRVAEGRGLLAADFTGKSDPYVKVKLVTRTGVHVVGSSSHQTKVRKQTLDPVWQEVLQYGDSSAVASSAEGRQASPIDKSTIKEASLMPFSSTESLGRGDTVFLPGNPAIADGFEFVLKDEDMIGKHDELGVVRVRFSQLFGDEDAVISSRTIRVDKWWRVRPREGHMSADTLGKLGWLHADITLHYGPSVNLMPEGWMEAVDDDTGMPYYCNTTTGESTWEEPDEVREQQDAMRQQREDEEAALRDQMRSSRATSRASSMVDEQEHEDEEGLSSNGISGGGTDPELAAATMARKRRMMLARKGNQPATDASHADLDAVSVSSAPKSTSESSTNDQYDQSVVAAVASEPRSSTQEQVPPVSASALSGAGSSGGDAGEMQIGGEGVTAAVTAPVSGGDGERDGDGDVDGDGDGDDGTSAESKSSPKPSSKEDQVRPGAD